MKHNKYVVCTKYITKMGLLGYLLTKQNACPTVKAFHRMNLNQNKCLNSNTASNITAKVAKPIKKWPQKGRLRMIEFNFFGMPIKTLGSLGKIRVGRVTGNTHIFLLRSTLFYIKKTFYIFVYFKVIFCWTFSYTSTCKNV